MSNDQVNLREILESYYRQRGIDIKAFPHPNEIYRIRDLTTDTITRVNVKPNGTLLFTYSDIPGARTFENPLAKENKPTDLTNKLMQALNPEAKLGLSVALEAEAKSAARPHSA